MRKWIEVALIVAVVGGGLGWWVSFKASLRKQGRIELLQEQRDSSLAAHDSVKVDLMRQLDSMSKRRLLVKPAPDTVVQTLLTQIQDTVVRVQFTTVLDTLYMANTLCEEENEVLRSLFMNEEHEHNATRALLGTISNARKPSRFSFVAAIGVGAVYDLRTQQMHVGPSATFGVALRF